MADTAIEWSEKVWNATRGCKTCGARAATSKTIMLCGRTGRLPGVKA